MNFLRRFSITQDLRYIYTKDGDYRLGKLCTMYLPHKRRDCKNITQLGTDFCHVHQKISQNIDPEYLDQSYNPLTWAVDDEYIPLPKKKIR